MGSFKLQPIHTVCDELFQSLVSQFQELEVLDIGDRVILYLRIACKLLWCWCFLRVLTDSERVFALPLGSSLKS